MSEGKKGETETIRKTGRGETENRDSGENGENEENGENGENRESEESEENGRREERGRSGGIGGRCWGNGKGGGDNGWGEKEWE